MKDFKSFGTKMREARIDSGLTMGDLARHFHISVSEVSRMERGLSPGEERRLQQEQLEVDTTRTIEVECHRPGCGKIIKRHPFKKALFPAYVCKDCAADEVRAPSSLEDFEHSLRAFMRVLWQCPTLKETFRLMGDAEITALRKMMRAQIVSERAWVLEVVGNLHEQVDPAADDEPGNGCGAKAMGAILRYRDMIRKIAEKVMGK